MRFKRIVALVLSFVMAAGLMACGKDAEDANKGDASEEQEVSQNETDNAKEDETIADAEGQWPDFSGITIRFAWWGSQNRHDATIQAIEKYEELTGINIEYEYYDYSGLHTQMDTLVAANDVWDVFQMGEKYTSYTEWIEPLDSYVEEGLIDVSDIEDSLLQITRDTNGNLVGLSMGTNCRVMAYNPALFEQAGLEEPTYGWTWDDYYEACEMIHEKTGAYGTSYVTVLENVRALCAQMGEGYNFYAKDGSGFAFHDDTSAIADMLDSLKALIDSGAIADVGVQTESGTPEESNSICTGESAMLLIPSTKFTTMSEVLPDGVELKMCALPKLYEDGQSGMAVRSAMMLCMSSKSTQKEAAAAFIDYMTNSMEANEILAGERGVPINETIRKYIGSQGNEAIKAVYDIVDEVSKIDDIVNTSQISHAANSEIDDTLNRYFQAMFLGEYATGQECADAMYEELKNIIAQY